jgi:hypothetical protein
LSLIKTGKGTCFSPLHRANEANTAVDVQCGIIGLAFAAFLFMMVSKVLLPGPPDSKHLILARKIPVPVTPIFCRSILGLVVMFDAAAACRSASDHRATRISHFSRRRVRAMTSSRRSTKRFALAHARSCGLRYAFLLPTNPQKWNSTVHNLMVTISARFRMCEAPRWLASTEAIDLGTFFRSTKSASFSLLVSVSLSSFSFPTPRVPTDPHGNIYHSKRAA